MTQAAVIVTTYNRPDALLAVLDGYLNQDAGNFEIIIADDGSSAATRTQIEPYLKHSRIPMRHVWQEDCGFRAAAIRNRALTLTRADYVIFTDGDCVPPAHFVRRHLALAERGHFLSGNRLLLGASCTAHVLSQRIPIHEWGAMRWLAAWSRRDVNRVLPLMALPDGAFRKCTPFRWEGVKTCNLSAWRADLISVNGFDESYSGWGLEDSDLVIRLIHAGVRHKSARFAAPVFHLWHRENDRGQLAENRRRLQEILSSQRTSAVIGLDQYS
jgi:glycosyltransferase involved in cell wall biosynthesis